MTSDLSAIRERGFTALVKELGPSGMAIFIRQFENGNGDYTQERDELLADLTIDDIVSSINKRKQQVSS